PRRRGHRHRPPSRLAALGRARPGGTRARGRPAARRRAPHLGGPVQLPAAPLGPRAPHHRPARVRPGPARDRPDRPSRRRTGPRPHPGVAGAGPVRPGRPRRRRRREPRDLRPRPHLSIRCDDRRGWSCPPMIRGETVGHESIDWSEDWDPKPVGCATGLLLSVLAVGAGVLVLAALLVALLLGIL